MCVCICHCTSMCNTWLCSKCISDHKCIVRMSGIIHSVSWHVQITPSQPIRVICDKGCEIVYCMADILQFWCFRRFSDSAWCKPQTCWTPIPMNFPVNLLCSPFYGRLNRVDMGQWLPIAPFCRRCRLLSFPSPRSKRAKPWSTMRPTALRSPLHTHYVPVMSQEK